MTERDIIEKINAVLVREFELNAGGLRPEVRFREDLGLDSLDAVELANALEREFGVKISRDPGISTIRTVADLHTFIIIQKREDSTGPLSQSIRF